jgi:hypothetical protein
MRNTSFRDTARDSGARMRAVPTRKSPIVTDTSVATFQTNSLEPTLSPPSLAASVQVGTVRGLVRDYHSIFL